jgi:hypothetical protein
MLTAFLALAIGLAFVALMARRNETATRQQWEDALSGECRSLDRVREIVTAERDMAEESYRAADRARSLEENDEAVKLLHIGARVVESCAGTLPELLRSLSLLSRQASAIAPIEPLEPARFKLAKLRGMVRVQAVVQAFLLTARERLAFRLRVLRYAIPSVTRWLVDATLLTAAEPSAPEHWAHLEHVRRDMGTLTDESLESLRVVVQSLAVLSPKAQRAAAQVSR